MKDCPCGQNSPFTDCCGPLLRGTGRADTAEDLMRSRYTACVLGDWDYLARTTRASEREDHSSKAYGSRFRDMKWKKLEVLDLRGGEADEDEGWVTFQAGYETDGVPGIHRETSKFVREQGRWVYCAEESLIHAPERKAESKQPFVRTQAKVGRNDPCPCGSGKKFKKCCGS